MIKEVAQDLLVKVRTKIAELDHLTDKPENKIIVDDLICDIFGAEFLESNDRNIEKMRGFHGIISLRLQD